MLYRLPHRPEREFAATVQTIAWTLVFLMGFLAIGILPYAVPSIGEFLFSDPVGTDHLY